MRRRDFLIAVPAIGFSLAAPEAHAQADVLVGYLLQANPDDFYAVNHFHVSHLRSRLCVLGWCGARQARIIVRAGETPAALAEAAAQLVRSNVQVIVVSGASAAFAAKQATARIPIVFSYATGPVTRRLVTSLSRPESNLTGFALMDETMPELLELVRELLPEAQTVAYLLDPANTPDDVRASEASEYAALAATLGLSYREVPVRSRAEMEAAIPAAKEQGVDALIVENATLFFVNRFVVAETAIHHHLPVFARTVQFGAAGSLISYGEDVVDLQEHAAVYVDRLLKGARVSDLPVQQAVNLELVVNARTARRLGIAVPPLVLARANEVIE